jgi:long-chain acyl-CoA synthetase
VPVSRDGSLRQFLRRAQELLEQGNVVLLFPEGTRSPDGTLREFKPTLGHIALSAKVDILPIWLEGTHGALPKGSALIKNRNLKARIGAPLTYEALHARVSGLGHREAAGRVTEIAHEAVKALRRGKVLHLPTKPEPASAPEQVSNHNRYSNGNGSHAHVHLGSAMKAGASARQDGLEALFERLRGRFVPGTTDGPLSYYFSLGPEKWTLKASSETCQVQKGKAVDNADCVLKTSPELFQRIVDEAYTPTPAEFVSGAVKSNNIQLLFTFQRMFKLTEQL